MSVDVIKMMNELNGKTCACGKAHELPLDKVLVGKGVVNELPEVIRGYDAKKAFVVYDRNTYIAGGKKVQAVLEQAGIPYTAYLLNEDHPIPDEQRVGSVAMHFDYSCDIIVTVGSGVLNDISKIIARLTGLPYIIVGTAPSMDGYASASSSMDRDGLKISLNTVCPNVVIGDVDILATAPAHMLKSGLGDMLAKYVSICEWRIAHLIIGEYYCEEVAALVRAALQRCVDNAEGLLKKDEEAIASVFEGLVVGGVAMSYAGVSRPASGVEHYFSHVWDMRGVEFGLPVDLHGIQCAVGTLIAAEKYEKIKAITPNRDKALAYAAAFDLEDWYEQLRKFLGKAAESMIALDKKEQKYDVAKHAARLDAIIARWDDILAVIEEELPSAATIEGILDTIKAPKTPADCGIDEAILPMTWKATKDIRDKYVLSRLAWDLGIIEEI